MRNNYIIELPEFDSSDVISEALKHIPNDWANQDNDKIVVQFESKYEWLGNRFNIYQLKKGSWPIHVDLGRNCSLNIPVKNCNETKITRFYKGSYNFGTVLDNFSDTTPKVKLESNNIIGFVTNNLDVDFEHVLTVPTIIRNDLPHDVINYNNDIRVIVSWTCRYDFETTGKMLKRENYDV
jgi:hypothetical protein